MDSEEPERLIVYKLVPKKDGTMDVTLSNPHKAFIIYLAKNGGETVMDWEEAEKRRTTEMEKRRESIREHFQHLIEMGIMSEIPLVMGNRVMLRLTDMGRNIADMLLGNV